MVEPDLVDRRDGGVGVGVCREQHAAGVGIELHRLEQELRAGHLRHALVDQEERDGHAAALQLFDGLERDCTRGCLYDPVIGPEMMPEVTLNGVEDFRVVIDRKQNWFTHYGTS